MSKTNKRPLTDLDLNPSPSTKRSRHVQHSACLPPAAKGVSKTSIALSPPTLIGSVSTSLVSQSSEIAGEDSVTCSDTSSSSSSSAEESSSDNSSSGSSSESSAESTPNRRGPWYTGPPPRTYELISTSGTETSIESLTSTSASVSDDISDSLSSSSHDEDLSASISSGSRDEDLCRSSSSSASPSGDSASPSPLTHTTTRTLTAENLSVLQKRLDSLLPRLHSANEQLEEEKREGRLDERNIENISEKDGDEGGRGYIQMDLGLGVLEEKGKREDEATNESESQSSSEGSSEGDDAATDGKENVVANLMGAKAATGRRKVKIEEVGGG